jgi:hypothetical protein
MRKLFLAAGLFIASGAFALDINFGGGIITGAGKRDCYCYTLNIEGELDRILLLYGLSYTYCHPKAEVSQLKDEELYFSGGERFPVSDAAYSDSRKVPAVKRFDFLSKDDGWDL